MHFKSPRPDHGQLPTNRHRTKKWTGETCTAKNRAAVGEQIRQCLDDHRSKGEARRGEARRGAAAATDGVSGRSRQQKEQWGARVSSCVPAGVRKRKTVQEGASSHISRPLQRSRRISHWNVSRFDVTSKPLISTVKAAGAPRTVIGAGTDRIVHGHWRSCHVYTLLGRALNFSHRQSN
jgi:hypothetical protein